MKILCLSLLLGLAVSFVERVRLHKDGKFRGHVMDDGGRPIVVFGNTDDVGHVYCFKLEGLFEAMNYDIRAKIDPHMNVDQNTYVNLEDSNLNWQYTSSPDGSQFSIFTQRRDITRAQEIRFDYRYRMTNDGNEALKSTIKIRGYQWRHQGASLVLQLDMEDCNDRFDIASHDNHQNGRRRMGAGNSRSTDTKDSGVSSDDSDEYDFRTAVFRIAPTASCGGRIVQVHLAESDQQYEGMHLVYSNFGLCELIHDPETFVDKNKVSSSGKIGSLAVFFVVLLRMLY